MVTCCVCGHEFEPNPDEVREWAESGRDFDPTDWTWPECQAAIDEIDCPDGYFKVSERICQVCGSEAHEDGVCIVGEWRDDPLNVVHSIKPAVSLDWAI